MSRPTVRITNRRKGGIIRWTFRLGFLGVVAAAQLAVLVAVGAYIEFSRDLPPVPSLEDYRPPTVSTFHGHDARLLGEFTTERRVVVPLEKMPRHLIEAFLAAEDKRFFEHDGVDVRATLRALLGNYVAGKVTSGASTLTQQLCKTLVGKERSYRRKAREAILARRTEAVLGKLDVLFLYLNQIYLGHGAYGVQAASRNYFRKDVWDLNLAESAMIAGLPPQPGRLTPVLDREGARRRQTYVLDRMAEEGFITKTEAAAAVATAIEVFPELPRIAEEGTPYFTEHVRKHVQARYGYERLNREGLKVHLTIDADLQRFAQDAIREGLHVMGERQGYLGPLEHLGAQEIEPFVTKLRDYYGGPPMLAPERYYLGVVTAAAKTGATVQVGAVTAQLPLKGGMSWAKPFDLEAENNKGRLTDVTDALTPGDVVIVRLNRGERFTDADPPVLALAQEPNVQGALVAMDPRTGYVRAMVGGYDFDQSEYNRAFQGCRQPGSVFKPIVYALALDRDYTLATPLDDTPIAVYDRKQQYIWKPKNFAGRYRGDVLLRNAFIHSMNIPAIRTIEHVGPDQAARFAEQLGITTPMHPDRSLVLGSSCVYPWDMVQVFAVFALRGRAPRTAFVTRVTDRDGRILEDRTHFSDPWAPVGPKLDGMLRTLFEPRELRLAEDTAYLVQTALRDVARSGTAAKAKKLGKPAGGKTGTTDAYDAWFVGFTESLVTGVWVGSDKNRRKLGKGETGGRVALPIWLDFMTRASEGVPQADFTETPPEGIEFANVDLETGLLAPAGNRALKLPFKAGTEPTEVARKAGQFGGADVDLVEGRF